MRLSSILAGGALLLAVNTTTAMAAERQNPFLQPYDTKYEIAPFDKITTADFIPAIKAGIEEQDRAINAIVMNRATPDFDNTILPLENLSDSGTRGGCLLPLYGGSRHSRVRRDVGAGNPLLNEANNKVNLNQALFDRIRQVYDSRDKLKLTPVQKRLVEKYYREFAEQGAALPADKRSNSSRSMTRYRNFSSSSTKIFSAPQTSLQL